MRQKFQAVAAVCRFIVFEDSTAAGQIAKMIIAEQLRPLQIVLREGAEKSTYMTAGMNLTSNVVREWNYRQDTLDDVVEEAAAWAETRLSERAKELENLYPWS